jgi:hypothetical protein
VVKVVVGMSPVIYLVLTIIGGICIFIIKVFFQKQIEAFRDKFYKRIANRKTEPEPISKQIPQLSDSIEFIILNTISIRYEILFDKVKRAKTFSFVMAILNCVFGIFILFLIIAHQHFPWWWQRWFYQELGNFAAIYLILFVLLTIAMITTQTLLREKIEPLDLNWYVQINETTKSLLSKFQ